MCAAVYSSLLLFTLTIMPILFSTTMTTEGLPVARRERGIDRGVLAGDDFLSVFLRTSVRDAYQETTSAASPSSPSTEPEVISYDQENSHAREIRSTSYTTPSTEEAITNLYETTTTRVEDDDRDEFREQSSDDSGQGVVVAVHISSSLGRTVINKNNTDEGTTEESTDQNFVASEEHSSIVAEANKSEFSVEESEPITTNSELSELNRGYPASVQSITRNEHLGFNPTSGFISQQLNIDNGKDKLQPIQHTVIFHNNPREPARARSVSYSTVIQSVPNSPPDKVWHDRRERHYDGAPIVNQLLSNHTEKMEKNWEKPEEVSTRKVDATTEKNWEMQEKAYSPPPKPHVPMVYGRPEQNYEVDESASVMTNGRAHGVQPGPTLPPKQDPKTGDTKKPDDNQKVGYVVEGRNYRKYRVEERTSDGFIVGEYGVVSHDDGSLRGVRYTADGTTSPRLIYDALMKFLSL